LKREIIPASENIEDFVSGYGLPVREDRVAERRIERGARSGGGNNREFFFAITGRLLRDNRTNFCPNRGICSRWRPGRCPFVSRPSPQISRHFSGLKEPPAVKTQTANGSARSAAALPPYLE
jgi:hypothetical protein